jgi:pyruvate carboxylase subunit B
MILGRMGQLPGALDPEIIALAKRKGLEFYTGNPQDEFPNELERYRQIMKTEGWDCGQDDEELFELAMHERQYRDYKTGVAKERFNRELEDKKSKTNESIAIKQTHRNSSNNDEVYAAIALAIEEYLNDTSHDKESYIITIKR